jgi:hypothetical protein
LQQAGLKVLSARILPTPQFLWYHNGRVSSIIIFKLTEDWRVSSSGKLLETAAVKTSNPTSLKIYYGSAYGYMSLISIPPLNFPYYQQDNGANYWGGSGTSSAWCRIPKICLVKISKSLNPLLQPIFIEYKIMRWDDYRFVCVSIWCQ